MHTFLFEIGTEELPAREIDMARTALLNAVTKALDEVGIAYGATHAWATPRRLAFLIEGLAPTSDVREEELIGPPARIAFDAEGRPTKAAEGFARKEGIPLDALRRVETPKGEYLAATVRRGGEPTAAVLKNAVPAAISAIPWKRSMRWGWGQETFSRPVHWMLALLDADVLELEWNGIPSGRTTRGHRFLAPEAFDVASPDAYRDALRDAWVIVDPDERRKRIREELTAAAAARGARLVDDEGLLDFDDLLTEVVHLVEWPVALTGTFDEALLEVPREVLVTSMASHQRYFALAAPDTFGDATRLTNYFAYVTNMDVPPGTPDHAARRATLFATVTAGNLRVLRARLEDARFFYREDRRVSLAARVPQLGRITFMEELGPDAKSELARTERNEALVRWLAPRLVPGRDAVHATAARATRLMLADRTTGMVDEFPELERVMGRYYALEAGGDDERETAEVARAIAASLAPRNSGSPISDDLAGSLVGLASRLQRTVDIFAVGREPTGSADPYAARRNAIGVIELLAGTWEGGATHFALDLQSALTHAASLLPEALRAARPTLVDDVRTFIQTRLRNWLKDREIATDIADAVATVVLPDAGPSQVWTAADRGAALMTLRTSPDFEPLAAAFRRIDNILRKAADEGLDVAPAVDDAGLQEPAERALAEALRATEGPAGEALQAQRWSEAADRLIALKPAIDRFFDDVMVNADDPALRRRRLALLAALRALFLQLADIARIQPSAGGG